MTEIEMQKKSRASHKAVATSHWMEAEPSIPPTRSVSLEDALIRLVQPHKYLARKQYFLRDLNSKIQAKIDDEATLEDDTLKSDEYDDKLVQQLDQIDRFIKRNTLAHQHHHLYRHPQEAPHLQQQQSYPNGNCRHSLEITPAGHLFSTSSKEQFTTTRHFSTARSCNISKRL